jgi:hypothetical protein
MKTISLTLALTAAVSADTAITIYNQNLATIRESLNLNLKDGVSHVVFDQATSRLLPDSVVLRDPAGAQAFSILEQSYRNDPVSPGLLLSLNEGKEIDFRTTYADGRVEIIRGKIVRSGYVPGGQPQSPIIEVDGKLRFQLPGEPMFPSLGDESILKPTLSWQIHSRQAAAFPAQLSYLTRGMSWEANYNLVAPEKGNLVTVTGWITATNESGTTFRDASVKLVAGDVNIEREKQDHFDGRVMSRSMSLEAAAPEVTQKAFDDFHLYSLPRPITLRDKETKQIEFLRAQEVTANKIYFYDPAAMFRFQGGLRLDPIDGHAFPKEVAIYWELENSEENGLGVPLPGGRIRFYREDADDSNVEFIGENRIQHTPRNEKIRVYTGNAFDLVGERKITNFNRRDRENRMSETVEVKVKNRSEENKTIIIREHLWRAVNWEVKPASADFTRFDANTIEFEINLGPDEERVVTYTASYSW